MLYSHDDDTIVAQCTPVGSGAIALIKISGASAVSVANTVFMLASGKQLKDCVTHTVHFARAINACGEILDQVMVILMRAPHTFTGQDTVEITTHNNQFIIESVIQRVIACGARMAQHGEFTRRAVLHNKMDLLQAEALNELIHANTAQVVKQSLAQLEGSFSSWISSIEHQLLRLCAFSEASFEFIDEAVTFDDEIKEGMDEILTTIAHIKHTFNAQQQIRQGIRIAFIGSVNAGKSSLFNAIIRTKRSIVSPNAGTTRDTIEAGLYRNGAYWTLIDTAGLRQTNDSIEQEGIQRAHQEAGLADIIILVIDSSSLLTSTELIEYEKIYQQYRSKVVIVYSKSDRALSDSLDCFDASISLMVSSLTSYNIDTLESFLAERIATVLASAASPYLVNQRQYHLLLGLEKQLHEVQKLLVDDIAYELLSYHLQDALAHIGQITGKTVSENSMDAIFRQFCIGK